MKYVTAKVHFEIFCKDHKVDLKWEDMPDHIQNAWYRKAEYDQWIKECLNGKND